VIENDDSGEMEVESYVAVTTDRREVVLLPHEVDPKLVDAYAAAVTGNTVEAHIQGFVASGYDPQTQLPFETVPAHRRTPAEMQAELEFRARLDAAEAVEIESVQAGAATRDKPLPAASSANILCASVVPKLALLRPVLIRDRPHYRSIMRGARALSATLAASDAVLKAGVSAVQIREQVAAPPSASVRPTSIGLTAALATATTGQAPGLVPTPQRTARQTTADKIRRVQEEMNQSCRALMGSTCPNESARLAQVIDRAEASLRTLHGRYCALGSPDGAGGGCAAPPTRTDEEDEREAIGSAVKLMTSLARRGEPTLMVDRETRADGTAVSGGSSSSIGSRSSSGLRARRGGLGGGSPIGGAPFLNRLDNLEETDEDDNDDGA
jgi:hypothetical protein